MQKLVPSWLGTPRRRVAALLAFVNLMLFAVVWIALESSYQHHRDGSETASRNISHLLSQSVASDIDRIDIALVALVGEMARLQATHQQLDSAATKSFLAQLHAHLPMVMGLSVTNADGIIVVGTKEGAQGISLADRPYFQRLRDHPQPELLISSPLQGRLSGKNVLVFARRLEQADGRFSGMVYAAVEIAWFEDKVQNLDLGRHGAVALRGDATRGFDLVVRFPPQPQPIPQSTMSATFQARIAANPQGGTYEAKAGSDGVTRIVTYQAISSYPLISMVGLATEDMVEEWFSEAFKVLLLAGVFLVVTLLGGLGLIRSWRTLEVRTEQLARSNADLEQFAYVASHDLQTPLRNIGLYTQLLARRYRDKIDDDANEFIKYIVDGSKNMARMISDILEYSRISSREFEKSSTDLAEALHSVLKNLGPILEEAGGWLCIGALPVVQAERVQMESLLQNLIENAVTYRHPERAPRIEIWATHLVEGRCQIAIRDNGIGIDPAYREKVFDIFQRLAPQAFPNGTGIGLALCRRIVQRFGGAIWIDSDRDVGVTFRFTLPAEPERDEPAAAA